MKRMKRALLALACALVPVSFGAMVPSGGNARGGALLGATSFWEGTAVASSYGEFPADGLYAACSSFPRNSVVLVENLENGKKIQVLVTRSLDNPGVFISLSPEASAALEIPIGLVSRVRVSQPQGANDALVRSDTPGTTGDPDLNPAALVSRERIRSGIPAPGAETAETGMPSVATAENAGATPAPLAIGPSPRPAGRVAIDESLAGSISPVAAATSAPAVAMADERPSIYSGFYEAPPLRARVSNPS